MNINDTMAFIPLVFFIGGMVLIGKMRSRRRHAITLAALYLALSCILLVLIQRRTGYYYWVWDVWFFDDQGHLGPPIPSAADLCLAFFFKHIGIALILGRVLTNLRVGNRNLFVFMFGLSLPIAGEMLVRSGFWMGLIRNGVPLTEISFNAISALAPPAIPGLVSAWFSKWKLSRDSAQPSAPADAKKLRR
jgi:hypothetical protein